VSWRTIATIIIVVFVGVAAWMALADPLVMIAEAFKGLETSGYFGYNDRVDGLVGSFFNMFLILIFGVIAWGVWWVVRRELSTGRI
jgi:hypothetical protein